MHDTQQVGLLESSTAQHYGALGRKSAAGANAAETWTRITRTAMRRHRHMVPRATQLHLTAWRVGRFQLKTRNINLRLPEKCGCPTGQV